MAFTLDNPSGNIIVITNTSESDSLLYTIYKLVNDGVFEVVSGYTDEPETEIEPSSDSGELDLIDDGLYKLITNDPDNEYYFVLNYNLRVCEKEFLHEILCQTCAGCDDTLARMKIQLKFKVLKERFYYIVNKYVQDQSVYDLISPENAELLYFTDILEQLQKICGNCSGETSGGCGCH